MASLSSAATSKSVSCVENGQELNLVEHCGEDPDGCSQFRSSSLLTARGAEGPEARPSLSHSRCHRVRQCSHR